MIPCASHRPTVAEPDTGVAVLEVRTDRAEAKPLRRLPVVEPPHPLADREQPLSLYPDPPCDPPVAVQEGGAVCVTADQGPQGSPVVVIPVEILGAPDFDRIASERGEGVLAGSLKDG
jgi:hypothetical protein